MMTGVQERSQRVKAIEPMIRAFYDAPKSAQASVVGDAVAFTLIGLGMFPALPAPTGTAGDIAARRDGYTRLVYIEGGMMGGEFLIQPDTDLDAGYRAWGVDWQEWTTVCGWNVTAEDID